MAGETIIFGSPQDGGVATTSSGSPIRKPDPTREYVAGGDGYSFQTLPKLLPQTIDDLSRFIGFRVYEAMLVHHAIISSVLTLKLGVMSGRLQLVETHPMKAGQDEPTPEQKLSQDVKEFCDRLTTRVKGFRSTLLQMMDCTTQGYKLGEIVAELCGSGPDSGRLVLKKLGIKKRESFNFMVDQHNNVLGIRFRKGSEFAVLPPEKFVRFTWLPKDDDPRGTSVLRAAYTPWNMAVQLYPQYFRYLKQFGSPSLIGKTAPGAPNVIVAGKTMTAQEYLLSLMLDFQNSSAMAIPAGSEIEALIPPGSGEPFTNGFQALNLEMVYSILLSSRATREAEHGSKADNEGGQDILGLAIEYGREVACEPLRDSLYHFFVALNYGQEIADTFTPHVYLGAVDKKKTAEMWNALANCYRAGAVTDSVRAEFHAEANAPIPDVEADKEAAEAKMKAEQEATSKSEGKEEPEEEKQLKAISLERLRNYAINRGYPSHFVKSLRL
jgi:hypothetical protein